MNCFERSGRGHAERGSVFVLTAASLVVLLAFSALAVDLGATWVERRRAQGAVDVGNLSGAQFVFGLDGTAAVAAVETEVRRISAVNMSTTNADWDGCTDPDRPAEFTIVATGTPCVSFTTNLSKIRVRAPVRDVPTSFASVIGINSLSVSAFSEVELLLGGAGDIIPFGLPVAASGSIEVCLKSGVPPLPAPPCDGPVQGNFGYADLTHFGGNYGGVDYPKQCVGKINDRLARNIANGVDHLVAGVVPQPASHREDRDVCTDATAPNILAAPHSIDVVTGTPNWVLNDGLIDGAPAYVKGGPGVPGRLTTGPFVGGPALGGAQLDNKPLWEFYGPGLSFGPSPASSDAPTSCAPSVITAAAIPHDAMGACLTDYTKDGYTGDLFTLANLANGVDELIDLQLSSRWGLVPELYTNLGPGGSTIHDVKALRPVFLQTIYACQGMSCKEHNPGEGSSIGGGNLDAVTAFLIPLETLPSDVVARILTPSAGVQYLLDR